MRRPARQRPSSRLPARGEPAWTCPLHSPRRRRSGASASPSRQRSRGRGRETRMRRCGGGQVGS
ncbi:hypothetical protein D3218_07985 [Aureimonas flava]|uniref:Uncharacterized protein n=1 Tax=Aureimonas flava TaxID=2320271 RepID=A0A3A1WJH5_9HYPH|nr:hypothetical protein D3218_07985 [Aureimonas flava]